MTAPRALAHGNAVLALAQTSGLRVFEGEAPADAVLPYALLWLSSGAAVADRLPGRAQRLDVPFQTTCVARDRRGAQDTADRLRAVLLDARPVVAGRQSSRISQQVTQPLRRDDGLNGSLLYLVDVYSFWTVPA